MYLDFQSWDLYKASTFCLIPREYAGCLFLPRSPLKNSRMSRACLLLLLLPALILLLG